MNFTDIMICVALGIVFTPIAGIIAFIAMLLFASLLPKR